MHLFLSQRRNWSAPHFLSPYGEYGYDQPRQPAVRQSIWLPALAITAFACLYLPLASLLVKASTPPESVAAAPTQTQSPHTSGSAAAASIPNCQPAASAQPSALVLDSKPAGLSAQVDPYNLYRVYGNTASDIRNQIEHCGPGTGNGSLADYTGDTSYNLSWQYSTAVIGSSCRIVNAKVGIHIVTTLPDWQAGSGATAGLGDRWQSFMTALETHEQGHTTLDKLYAANLVTSLNNVEPVSCDQLGATAKAVIQAGVNSLNQANDQYDQQTSHGYTQGADLPTY
jgi:predicted secreted Zn-dependent protease